MNSGIHLDNCGSSLPPEPVSDAVVEYLRREAMIGGYAAQAERADELDRVYSATAEYLGCGPHEVAFCSSASDAWWRAFASVRLEAGDRILLGTSEFQTGAFGALQAGDRGVSVEVVPEDGDGLIDLAALAGLLDERVKLVMITQISMANGAVQPAAEVGAIVRSTDALYLLDACQMAGQRPLDVQSLGCDFCVYTGRKFMRAMRGTGILYAADRVLDRLGPSPFVDGRSAEWNDDGTYSLQADARRFEFGEQNFAGKVGLAAATDYALSIGFETIADRITELSSRLRDGLDAIDHIEVRDRGIDRSGIVTFTSEHRQPAQVAELLAGAGVRVGAPGRRNAQLDLGRRGLGAVVRAGVHYFNTEAEIDRTLEVLATAQAAPTSSS